MRVAGSVNGKMQQAVQAAAARAVAAPAALLPVFPVVFVVAAQPQPGEFSDGGMQGWSDNAHVSLPRLLSDRPIGYSLKSLEVQALKRGAAMRIGIRAERTGTTAPTIRYYEEIGLLRAPARTRGQRSYNNDDVRRLAFIRRCRNFDFSIEEIRS